MRMAMAAAAAVCHYVSGADAETDAASEHPLAAEEWLASLVLEHIADARQVLRLALINRTFLSASLSDLVWQKRLPPKFLLDAITVAPNHHSPPLSKRDLYVQLCKSISYDNGLKKFWLDPASGADCYMISARALSIVWADTAESKPWPGAMFPEVAYLHSVCWFDVRGTFRQYLRPGKYTVSFRMQMNIPEKSLQGSPVKLSLHNTSYAQPPRISQVALEDTASYKRRFCPLPSTPLESQTQSTFTETLVYSYSESEVLQTADAGMCSNNGHIEGRHGQLSTLFNRFGALLLRPLGHVGCVRSLEPEHLNNSPAFIDTRNHAADWEERTLETFPFPGNGGFPPEWVECDVGEFSVEDDNGGRPIEVHFSMEEIEVFWWKGGLVLDGVIIRPSSVAESITVK